MLAVIPLTAPTTFTVKSGNGAALSMRMLDVRPKFAGVPVGNQLPELFAPKLAIKLMPAPLISVSMVPDRVVVRLPGACSARMPLPALVNGVPKPVPTKEALITPVADAVLVGKIVYVLA